MSQSFQHRERHADRVRAVLVEEILSGALGPGSRLDETGLAERFGVSRTPVREALQSLAASGLAERGHRRSFIVRRLEPESLGELFEALAEIEVLAARYAARRMTALERAILAELVREGDRLAEAGDAAAYAQLNMRFHQTLYDGAHNRFLSETAQNLRVRSAPYRQAQLTRPERLAQSQREHLRILRAIEAENPDAAAEAMHSHITAAGRGILGILSELHGARKTN